MLVLPPSDGGSLWTLTFIAFRAQIDLLGIQTAVESGKWWETWHYVLLWVDDRPAWLLPREASFLSILSYRISVRLKRQKGNIFAKCFRSCSKHFITIKDSYYNDLLIYTLLSPFYKRRVKKLTQAFTTRKQWSQDLNPGVLCPQQENMLFCSHEHYSCLYP